MAQHLHTGREGESLAVEWLITNGYSVIACNWRHQYYEIDIIAERNTILHFIEVKTRTNRAFGYPEESVSRKKFERLQMAAEEYLEQNPHWKRVQYDVLAIILREPGIEFYLIEDVYYF